jgi:crossover junction endodeoxyribonuclease RuvC
VRIFGIDPGSERTGYGCLESDGTRLRLITCGALSPPRGASFPDRLRAIHDGLFALIARSKPDCAVVESLFHAKNVRAALKLGHARGAALLAASQACVPVFEYAPAEIKRAVVGYGRAEKQQVQRMVTLLLGLDAPPTPFDATDALAAAICHTHATASPAAGVVTVPPRAGSAGPRSWRDYQPAGLPKA